MLLLPVAGAAQASAPAPLPVIQQAGDGRGPAVLLVAQPGAELVALRLSVPLESAFDDIAAGRVLQRLAEPVLRERATALGADLRLELQNGAAVYALRGHAADLLELVEILRIAVGMPAADPDRMSVAAHEVAQASLAELETPPALLRRKLAVALFPLLPTLSGRAAAVQAIGPAELRRFHATFFRPHRMRLVAVGPIDGRRLRAALASWTAPAGAPAPTAGALAPDPAAQGASASDPAGAARRGTMEAEPQVVRAWGGIGILAEDDRTGDLLVGAPFIRAALERDGLDRTSVEVWWQRGEAALVALGAAPFGSGLTSTHVAERIRTAVMDAVLAADDAAVRSAADAVLHEMLYDARTAAGMARLVGALADRADDPLALYSYISAIRSATAGSLAGTLLRLAEAPAVVAGVEP